MALLNHSAVDAPEAPHEGTERRKDEEEDHHENDGGVKFVIVQIDRQNAVTSVESQVTVNLGE